MTSQESELIRKATKSDEQRRQHAIGDRVQAELAINEFVVVVEGNTDKQALGVVRSPERVELIVAAGSSFVSTLVLRHATLATAKGQRRLIGVVDRDWNVNCCSGEAHPLCRQACCRARLQTEAVALTDTTDLESDLINLDLLRAELDHRCSSSTDVPTALHRAKSVAAEIGLLRFTSEQHCISWKFRDSDTSNQYWQRSALVLRPILEARRAINSDTLNLDKSPDDVFQRLGRTHGIPSIDAAAWNAKTHGQIFNGKDVIVTLVDVILRDGILSDAITQIVPDASAPVRMEDFAACCASLHRSLLNRASDPSLRGWDLKAALLDHVA